MDKTELKGLIAQLLQEMGESVYNQPEDVKEDTLQDLTTENIRMQYLTKDPENGENFLQLKRKTQARLGLGRAGARYRTRSMLRFRADHAAAQDSVFSLVEPSFWEKNGLVFVQTMCKDKDQYLTRPDFGRKFDEKNQQIIRKTCGNNPKILLVIGDGLSSDAVTANAPDCSAAIREGLKSYGMELGTSLFIQYARVGAMDHIGQLTGAEVICMLVGERPGLATSESMSAYITYKPYPGIAESKRTVISNIHRQGTPAVEAGAYIAELLVRILEKKDSGVDLRGSHD